MEGVVDAAVDGQLFGPRQQLPLLEMLDESERIVMRAAPARGIEVAIDRDDVRMPDPPQVARQPPQLVDVS